IWPARSFSTFSGSTSTHATSCPRSAKHAPVTSPTYPVPTIAMRTDPSRDRAYQASSEAPSGYDVAVQLRAGLDARVMSDDRVAHHRTLTDLRARVNDAPLDARARADVRAGRDRRQRPERRSGSNRHVAEQR